MTALAAAPVRAPLPVRSSPRTRQTASWKRLIAMVAAVTTLAPLTTARPAAAQEKVSTCVHVEAPASELEGLRALVRSEVDRHPSHRAVADGCSVHLRVELIQVGSDRFLTGRIGGEVPQRVHVEGAGGKALEAALDELLRIVLGNDPVALKAPGGQSWFSERLFSLRDRGRNSFDVGFLETASPVAGGLSFNPGVYVALSREIESWQVGLEGMWSQRFEQHPGRVDLDTVIRLQAAVVLFASDNADTSTFFGFSLGVAHQRFSGPRARDLGRGDGVYGVTGPGVGLRGGVEFFRTTTIRAFVLAEAFVPIFWADDQQAEVMKGWVPNFSLGGGVRF
jgi:hypothetical protein